MFIYQVSFLLPVEAVTDVLNIFSFNCVLGNSEACMVLLHQILA